jgi:hypothetical protein
VLRRRDEIQGHLLGIKIGRHRQMNVAVDKTGDDCTAREIQCVPASLRLVFSALADEAKASVLDKDLRIRQGWCTGSVYKEIRGNPDATAHCTPAPTVRASPEAGTGCATVLAPAAAHASIHSREVEV